MRRNEIDTFLSRVDMPRDITACWVWKLEKTGGYGRFCFNKRTRMAHRAAYELAIGKIRKGQVIDHLCRNRGCVNPLHLEQVTIAENVMRGYGPLAMKARQTHCSKGHALSGENLKLYSQGPGRAHARVCKTCENAKQRRKYNRKASK